MKKGWDSKPLIEYCYEITDGSHFSPKTSPDFHYPYITVRDIVGDKINFDNCKRVQEKDYLELVRNGCKPDNGDVLFSKDGTVGKVALNKTDKDFVVLSSLAILRPNHELILSAYLKYAVHNPSFINEAIGKKTGVAIRRIILKNLKKIHISVPESLAEQKQIVEILDKAFAAIDQAKANIEKNIENAKELFQSKLNEIFSQKVDGWEEKKLGDVCEFQNGLAFKSKSFKNDGIAVVRITNIQEGEVNLSKAVYVERQDYPQDLSKYEVTKGDLLIAMSGATTGKIGIYQNEHVSLLNQRVGKFIPSENLNKEFLYYFLSTKVEECLKISAGSAQPNLSTKQIKDFKIPLPEFSVQSKVVGELSDLSEKVDSLKKMYLSKVLELDELKKSILQKAFEGELTKDDIAA